MELALAVGQLAVELVREGEHALGVAQDDPAAVGQLNTAPAAVDQRLADVTLERAHLLADGRLADAQRLRRGRERATLVDLGQRAQMADIHKRTLSQVAPRCRAP